MLAYYMFIFYLSFSLLGVIFVIKTAGCFYNEILTFIYDILIFRQGYQKKKKKYSFIILLTCDRYYQSTAGNYWL